METAGKTMRVIKGMAPLVAGALLIVGAILR